MLLWILLIALAISVGVNIIILWKIGDLNEDLEFLISRSYELTMKVNSENKDDLNVPEFVNRGK